MTTALNLATLNAVSAQPAAAQAQAVSSSSSSTGTGDSGNPSFSQVLAGQPGSSAAQTSGNASQQAGAAGNASNGNDPQQAAQAVSQNGSAAGSTQTGPASKSSAKDGDKDASKDSDDTTATQIAASQLAQPGAQAVPSLPQQALEIAAQVAAVQTQVANRQSSTQSGATGNAATSVIGAAGIQARAQTTLLPVSVPQAQQGTSGAAALAEAAPGSAAAAQAPAPSDAATQTPVQNLHRTATGAVAASATKPAANATRDDKQPGSDAATTNIPQTQQQAQAQPAVLPAATFLPQHTAGGIQADAQLSALAASSSMAGKAPAASATSSQVPAVLSLTSAPVGSAQWNTDLGRQMVLLSSNAQNGSQTAELRLDPPNLGPLHVTINLNNGIASAAFVSAHAAVRQALESAMPQLQTAFEMAGLSLGQTSVGDQGAQSGQEQTASGSSSRLASVGAVDDGSTATAVLQVSTPRNANALVDTFA